MYVLVETVVKMLKRVVPDRMTRPFLPLYHRALAFLMAAAYGFPARRLTVLGVTGTKGKSTSAEMLFAILRGAGYTTALLSTIRFAIEDDSTPNLYKMTLPGRGFAQAFMKKAADAGCTHLVVEITSESTLNFRHWFFALDGLIVTNIQKEHLESHGSFENYVEAKREIVRALERSRKKVRVLVANADQPETKNFLTADVPQRIPFRTDELEGLVADDTHAAFTYKHVPFTIPLPGAHNAHNALAAVKLTEAFRVPLAVSAKALATMPPVKGRGERVEAGQSFVVVVDYAHTPDSLRALYGAFRNRRKICVLGNTGGGRDTWKREEMGRIAEETCDTVVLTNEDPYDEDPRAIVEAMAAGMKKSPTILMDRREAIRYALHAARPGDAVLISGKGTDPYIMGPKGTKEPWSDAGVAREELAKLLGKESSPDTIKL